MLLHVELLLGEDADVDEFLELLQRFHLSATLMEAACEGAAAPAPEVAVSAPPVLSAASAV